MKLKGIVLAVIISLASIMMPFNVYADTISSTNVIGVNVELLGSTILEHREDNGNNYYFKQYSYKAVIELDNSYVGVIGARVQGNYYEKAPVQGSQLLTQAFNYYRKIYVNGNSAEMTFVISTWYSSVQDPINYRADGTSPYVTIEDSNVTKYEDLDSIEQIIDLLSDIYQNSNDIEGLSTNQLTELQNIVSNTLLANQYLEIISKLKQFNIPIESYSSVMRLMAQHNNKLTDIFGYNYWDYPIFRLLANDEVVNTYFNRNTLYRFIFYISKPIISNSTFLNYFSFNREDITVSNYINLSSRFYIPNFGNGYIISVDLMSSANESLIIQLKENALFTCFYMGLVNNQYISTEFALRFGLSNSLLDNIQLIANGTQQSNSAASNLESSNDQMADDMDDLATIESGYNQQFNNQLQQIDFSSPFQNNAGILPAANFVITIFNGLINNNPFSVLIIIVCILLIGKKVIGK